VNEVFATGLSATARGTFAPMNVRARDELFVLWSAARAEANIAYDAWCDEPGRTSYAVYRAAEDRADAAEIALSAGVAGSLAVA
jgi:hypothetical protein